MHVRKIALLAAAAAALAVPAAASADGVHVVASGESLSSIAAQDGVSVAALAAANGLSTAASLTVGQVVEIPTQTESAGEGTSTTATGAEATAAAAPDAGGYTVQIGDTLSAIAARDDTTVAELAAVNGIDPSAYLVAGAQLVLPAYGTRAPTTAAATSTESAGASAGSEGSSSASGGGALTPTTEPVSGSEIAQVAEDNGVSPSLAQAIAWQESGWDDDEISDTGAIGVMQIEPSTWTWIEQHLSGGALNGASAYDHIEAGVLLLKDLVSVTGSDALAAAGYYQGIASVDKEGELPSTQRYVADVTALQGRFGG